METANPKGKERTQIYNKTTLKMKNIFKQLK